jgi:hypothetical protein
MRILALGVLAFALLTTACESSDATDDATTDATIDESDPASIVGTAPPTTSSTEPDVVDDDEPATDDQDLDAAASVCDQERQPDNVFDLDGDFDADGTIDRVVFDQSQLTLVVCLTDGAQTLDVGLLELLGVTDLDRDGRDEILAGGTAAWGTIEEVIAVADGELDFVSGPSGERLTLVTGIAVDDFYASGCGSFSGSGDSEITTVEGTVDEAGVASWERTVYRLDGHEAIEVSTDSGTFDTGGSGDPLSTPDLQELISESC